MSSEAVYRVLRLGFLNGYVVPVENDPYNQLRASLVGRTAVIKSSSIRRISLILLIIFARLSSWVFSSIIEPPCYPNYILSQIRLFVKWNCSALFIYVKKLDEKSSCCKQKFRYSCTVLSSTLPIVLRIVSRSKLTETSGRSSYSTSCFGTSLSEVGGSAGTTDFQMSPVRSRYPRVLRPAVAWLSELCRILSRRFRPHQIRNRSGR